MRQVSTSLVPQVQKLVCAFQLYCTTLQPKVASVSITILMLQPQCPLGASYFVARSTKRIHVGSKAGIFQLKVEILSLRAVSTKTHLALSSVGNKQQDLLSIESNEKMKVVQQREAPTGHS